MFRILALAAVLLAAANAQAATLTASSLMPSILSDTALPWESTFQLNQGINDERTTIAEFTFPTVAENDTFVITEANVGDFGETWANVVTWADGLNEIPHWTHRVVNWTHNGTPDQGAGQSVESRLTNDTFTTHVEDFVPTSFTLEFFFLDRAPPQLDRAQLRWTLVGEGTLVPEPSALLVFLTTLVPMLIRSTRRNPCL